MNVKAIALLIAEGNWHTYKSPIEYGVAHGISPATVTTYAKEAARLIRIAWGDDSTKTVVLEKIQRLGEDAANRTEEVLNKEGVPVTIRKPDYKSAIHAAEVVASILGMTRQQHELRVTYERMSDEQLYAEALKFVQKPAELVGEVVETSDEQGNRDEENHVEDADAEVEPS